MVFLEVVAGALRQYSLPRTIDRPFWCRSIAVSADDCYSCLSSGFLRTRRARRVPNEQFSQS